MIMKKLIAVLLLAVLAAGIIGNCTKANQNPETEVVKKSIVIDLSNGYCVVPSSVEDYLKEAGVAFSVSETSGSAMFDIDGDGVYDMSITPWSPFRYPSGLKAVATPCPGESGGKTLTVKPRGTTWITNDGYQIIDVTEITITTGEKRTINEEYSVSVTGGYAIRYVSGEDQWIPEKVTKAAPGERVYLITEAPSGQYLKKWNSNIIRFLEEFPGETEITSYWFVMPAADVSFTADYGTQVPATLEPGDDIYYEGDVSTPGSCFMQSILNAEWYDDMGLYDLDGDGTDDIDVSSLWSGYTIHPCPLGSVSTYTAEGANDGPYWPVTAEISSGRYEITSDDILTMSISPKNTALLMKSLEEWKVAGKSGVYDLDKDGSDDFCINGYVFLPTCSFIGSSVTIPASTEGIHHEIRFVCDEPSKRHHSVTVITENEGNILLSYSGDLEYGEAYGTGCFWEANRGVFLIPEEGYRIQSVKSDDVKIEKDSRNYYFFMPSRDVTLRVQFYSEEPDEPTLTPTVTPTPTAEPKSNVTATPDITETPTVAPTVREERGRDSLEKKNSDSMIWLWFCIGIELLVATVAGIIMIAKRKKNTD